MPELQIIPNEIDHYVVEHTTPLPKLLEELIRETHAKFGERAEMLSGQVEGQLLRMLVAATGAQRVLEIGTFTGFSALMMASGLPSDGELVTLELSKEHADFARGFIARSPDGGKIRLIEGPALESLKTLRGPFDFAFIDADKTGYPAYFKAALRLLAHGGLIALDNALREGDVLDPKDEGTVAIAQLNDVITKDDSVENVLLTVRDGVMLVRKK